MAKKPNLSVDQLVRQAYEHYQKGEFGKALRHLEKVPLSLRSHLDFLLLSGACLAKLKRADEAIPVYERVLELDPNNHDALTWLALLSEPSVAIEYAKRAVAAHPSDAGSYGVLGVALLAAKLPFESIDALTQAVRIAPKVPEHRHNLGLAFAAAHRNDEAIAAFREAIRLAPGAPQNYLAQASVHSQFGLYGAAIECLSEGLAKCPRHAPLETAVAGAYAMVGNDEEAERHHHLAMQISPSARSGYGTWLINQGRFEESAEIFERMLREGKDRAYAYYSLMLGKKLTGSDGFLSEMEGFLASGELRGRDEMYLRYALGRACEQTKRYEEAMGHFDRANALALEVNRTGAYVDPARFAEEHRQIRELYSSLPEGRSSSDVPIFIIGMIRSGTTLLDQILSSHPMATSGGELRFWIEETRRLVLGGKPDMDALAKEYVEYARLLAGGGERVTDKMPLNFASAGVIHRALPNARFVHIRRNPIDTCLSIWTTYFGPGPVFGYDKRNVVEYYREYLRTMEFWRGELPADRLFEVDYEDLTDRPAEVIPSIISFLGLPWDDSCLHHDANTSAINTPSRWQARQPIYRSSVERWRRYEPWLGEFGELV
ncbi:MAG: sulfotransferase [Armatimonadetes bacterium]|nr:sulfotransferase [Armatimonadota bacterium]